MPSRMRPPGPVPASEQQLSASVAVGARDKHRCPGASIQCSKLTIWVPDRSTQLNLRS
jgi:hypothetical protein